jgi:hypothetical protein
VKRPALRSEPKVSRSGVLSIVYLVEGIRLLRSSEAAPIAGPLSEISSVSSKQSSLVIVSGH